MTTSLEWCYDKCKRLHFGRDSEALANSSACNCTLFTALMTKRSKPTLEDVARLANVSTATISRSLNEPEKVARSTRERINHAIEQLAYTPNFSAKALATNKSNIVGAIIPTMANAMFASGLQAFQEELAQSGVLLLVASSAYDSENEFQQIQSLLAHGADGLLLIGTERPRSTLSYLEARNIPFVISWCYQRSTKRLYAGFNNKESAAAMTARVIEFGHRHIAMIAGVAAGNDRAANRIAGVKQMIESHRRVKLVSITEAEYTLAAGASAFDQVWAVSPSRCNQPCQSTRLASAGRYINHRF